MPGAWVIIVSAGAVLAALRVTAPDAPWWPVAALATIWSVAALTGWAALRRHTAGRAGWGLIALAEIIHGTAMAAALPGTTPVTSTHPIDRASPAELAATACVLVGCLLLARRGRVGRQVDAWLDAAVLGITGGILAWELVLAPAIARQAINLTPGTLGVLGAEVVVGMLAGLVLINPPVPRRISVLYLAILALLVSEIASPMVEIPDAWLVPWLQAAWLLGFPASAALALHPAAIRPPAPPEPRDDAVEHVHADRARLVVLGVSLWWPRRHSSMTPSRTAAAARITSPRRSASPSSP